MDADERLRRLLNEAAPPARDFAFQAAVMQRVARHRFLFSLLALLPWAVASAVLLWIVSARIGGRALGGGRRSRGPGAGLGGARPGPRGPVQGGASARASADAAAVTLALRRFHAKLRIRGAAPKPLPIRRRA